MFGNYVLRTPDFIEFDDLNGKAITKHSGEGAFRVWDLETYKLLYPIFHENIFDFKIW